MIREYYPQSFSMKLHPWGDGARVIDKFNAKNFNTWKVKLETELTFMDLWGIVKKFDQTPSSNVDPKVNNK